MPSIARQDARLQANVEEKWQAYGVLYDQFADADGRLAVLVADLINTRRSAARAARQALAAFSNADQYGHVLAGLRRYVAVMRHVPVLLMSPTPKPIEMVLGEETTDVVARKVIRECGGIRKTAAG